MKDNCKLFIKYVMRLLLKIYWIFPIQKKRIFFMANMGKGYLCNPKYIYQSIVMDDRFKNYKFIWSFVKPKKQLRYFSDSRTKFVKKGNYFLYFYYLLTSGIIVYNCGGFSYAPIREDQFLIETGHGGGLQKRNGFMVKNKSAASNKGILLADRDIKLWLASDEMHEKIYIRKAMGYKGEILKSGYPRSDIFFQNTENLKEEIRNRLGISRKTKVILYAPTFKGNESNASTFIANSETINVSLVKSLMQERFGGEWIFATRGHLYSQQVPLKDIDYDWTSYDDMQELLLVADVLITDYSSCVWDFFVLDKLTFLFVPDKKHYEESDRGFYIPLEQWPAIIVNNNNEWKSKIKLYDEQIYKMKLKKYSKMMGSYEKGIACEIVKERILKEYER